MLNVQPSRCSPPPKGDAADGDNSFQMSQVSDSREHHGDVSDGDNSLERSLLEQTVSDPRDEHRRQCQSPFSSLFARFRAELLAEFRQCRTSTRRTSTFCLCDPGTDQVIHIPSSFGPTGLLVLLWKSIVAMWILSCLILGVQDQANQGHLWMYFALLTNWGVMASLLYIICSLLNSAVTAPRQPAAAVDNESSCPSRWICFTWILFEIAAHTEIAVTLLYWSSIREPAGKTIVYAEYMPHGIVVMLVLLDGLLVNRIPVRLSHCWKFVLWFDLFYMMFTAVYEFSGIGHGPLYPTVQWKDDFTGTLVRDILSLTILCPVLYVFLYAMSILSCRRYCLPPTVLTSLSNNDDVLAFANESDS